MRTFAAMTCCTTCIVSRVCLPAIAAKVLHLLEYGSNWRMCIVSCKHRASHPPYQSVFLTQLVFNRKMESPWILQFFQELLLNACNLCESLMTTCTVVQLHLHGIYMVNCNYLDFTSSLSSNGS